MAFIEKACVCINDIYIDVYISRVGIVLGVLGQKDCWHVPEIFSNIQNSHKPLIISGFLQDDRMSVASSEKVLAFDKMHKRFGKVVRV